MANKPKDPTPEPTPEPTPTPDPTPTPEPAPAPAPAKTYTQAELEAERKKWEKETAKKLADAEAKAKLSEDERKDAELAEAKRQLAERDKRDKVKDAAAEAGVKNASRFYNAYKDDLEFDDKGNITNLKEVIEAAKTEMPEFFGAAQPPKPAGSADAGEGKTPPASLTKEQVDKMTPDEINKNWDAVSKFLATQK